jgi:phenylalanyl-tRNA synthetase beta subunit
MKTKKVDWEYEKTMFNLTEDILCIMEHKGVTIKELAKGTRIRKRYLKKLFGLNEVDIKFKDLCHILRYLGFKLSVKVENQDLVMLIQEAE